MVRRLEWLLVVPWRLSVLVALLTILPLIALGELTLDRGLVVLLLVGASYLFARTTSQLSRQRRALGESLEREAATSKVIQVMTRSRFDIDDVFRAILTSAIRICDADWGTISRLDGNELVPALQIGGPAGFGEALRRNRSEAGKDTVEARVLLEKHPVHVVNVQKEFPRQSTPSDWYRTALLVPMLRDERVLGAIGLYRYDMTVTANVYSGSANEFGAIRMAGVQPSMRPRAVYRGTALRPFSDREIKLVETFADQAAIAIENVRLFTETKESLEQQRATADMLKVISRSSFDLVPVLDTVLETAARLSNAQSGVLALLEGDAYRFVSTFGLTPELRAVQMGLVSSATNGTSIAARTARARQPVQIADVLDDPDASSRLLELQRALGFRSMLGVPLLREGLVIGVLSLRRNEVRPFDEREVALVQTFADQAVIALENVRLFNEIQDKGRQLEVASKHKSEFLANMSHELRTPLNAIIGFADVLVQKMFGELNEKQKDYLNDIATSGRHLLDLVNQILDLSKVEAGRMELEPSAFAPAETIRASLAFVRERAAAHRIQVAAEIPADLPTVTADERKIRQVLLNLLSNAVKFTPDGGTIGIAARAADGELEISVKDTGIGIPPEDQAAVFEEFRQVGQGADRSREGTGLGLTLAKRFVELHGGRIWVESAPGKGSTFTFAIPVERPAAVVAG
ncbi:MAG TPA: ATP-binding protein [Candidatus Limnocylindria bacterium]